MESVNYNASVLMGNINFSLNNFSCFRNNQPLFRPIDLQIKPSSLIVITGPNGVGKTTLLENLSGLRQQPTIDWGNNYFCNRLYCGHKLGLSFTLNCLYNLNFFATMQNLSLKKHTLLNLLDSIDLSGYEYTPVSELSAGQKKKMSLLRLKLSKAKLWLLDEPFANLDNSGINWLTTLLKQHISDGNSVILSTHQHIEHLSSPDIIKLMPYE